MSAAIIDSLFSDETKALHTLGSNFDRLANSMERVAKSRVFGGGKLKRVAELGGGTGLIGMWLIKNGLCEKCEIYDHSKNALSIGQRWSSLLGVSGIEFRNHSYLDLRTKQQEPFDFVFAEHPLPFDYLGESSCSLDDFLKSENCPLLPQYQELASAFQKLLKPSAIGLIGSGTITPLCATALCFSLREYELSIDWDQTSNEDGLQVFFKKNVPFLFGSADEEALAILSDVKVNRHMPKQDALSWERIFQSGQKYLDILSEFDGKQYRCLIFQHAGLGGLFQAGPNGFKAFKIFSAGKIPTFAHAVLEDSKQRRLVDKYLDSRLLQLIES
jgi:hypothetical protein